MSTPDTTFHMQMKESDADSEFASVFKKGDKEMRAALEAMFATQDDSEEALAKNQAKCRHLTEALCKVFLKSIKDWLYWDELSSKFQTTMKSVTRTRNAQSIHLEELADAFSNLRDLGPRIETVVIDFTDIHSATISKVESTKDFIKSCLCAFKTHQELIDRGLNPEMEPVISTEMADICQLLEDMGVANLKLEEKTAYKEAIKLKVQRLERHLW
ncbi:hypothetical protein CVT24_000341 [Panaeolus cyanescens]|uniref:Uncharacterized protein n=1 Tax=Panaeolus cyanescens TaxID=181874 RepID=A0A409VIX0_9AGAR|nr:hypothetical protein CVT24_000341 [Panaeolus cyanescens]